MPVPTASCGALRERELPHSKVRARPLSSLQQAEGYSALTFIKRSYSDISKARAILGFMPKVKLREGLKGLWQSL